MKPVGKPDAGNPHVRFDERGGETGCLGDTAPLLDSTGEILLVANSSTPPGTEIVRLSARLEPQAQIRRPRPGPGPLVPPDQPEFPQGGPAAASMFTKLSSPDSAISPRINSDTRGRRQRQFRSRM
jgi:hypothetical protein